MDEAFANITAAAVAVGWNPGEVAVALVELAENRMLALLPNRDLEQE